MSDEKKSFFESLDAKSALMVGMVGGLLALGTIGFVILGIMAMKGGVNCSAKSAGTLAVADQNQPATQQDIAPVPTNAPKSDKPVAEVFVMSYCPYGIQMEEAVLPVMDLLKNKADIKIKFVSYAMHGQKELEENTRQYCVQGEQSAKYLTYLNCFVGSQNADSCLATANVDKAKLQKCVDATNKKFGTMDKFNDQSTWLSGQYPLYPVHEDLNQKYGVQGSPTVVLNGVQINVGRTPEAVKQAICAAFNKAPSECSTSLGTTGAATPAGGCGN